MKACFASEMRGVDKAASEIGGIPSIVLMENAAMACVEELKNDFANLSEKSVAVFCGKGNNGGDGFAIARHLINKGAETNVYLVCGSNFHGDAEINYNIIDNMSVSIEEVHDLELLEYIVRASDIVIDAIFAIARHLYNMGIDVAVYLVCGNEFKGDAKINFDIIKRMNINIDVISDIEDLKYIVRSYDIIVDAIFGTGISGTVRGISYDVISEINDNAKYIMAVDVPSGINSDSGEICGVCIKADKTVTLAAYKVGMLMFPAADYVGKAAVKNISIPDYIIDGQNLKINVIDDKFVRSNFPKRENNSQKGDYGKVLVIAGSAGMTGAAYLSSQTAVTTGSGLVTLAVPSSLNGAMEAKTTEVMTVPLSDKNGRISAGAIDEILKRVDKADTVLIGPGLGRCDDVSEVVESVLEYSKVPVIIDADGINAVAENMKALSSCTCPVIFTPHTVEMSRLTGLEREYIEDNRLVTAKEFAEENGVTLILKGHHTIVTGQDGEQYINITGNSGLATGGSGDVLAGTVASLVSRGINETVASAMAVYIHGLAGDIAKDKYGIESVTASKVMECIPCALRQILQVEN